MAGGDVWPIYWTSLNSLRLLEKSMEVLETTWLPPRDSNPDMLIQSPFSDSGNKENKPLLLQIPAKSCKIRNPDATKPKRKRRTDGRHRRRSQHHTERGVRRAG